MLEDHLKPRVALWAHIAAGVCLGILSAGVVSAIAALLILRMSEGFSSAPAPRAIRQLRDAQASANQAATPTNTWRQDQAENDRRQAEADRAAKVAEADRRELAWTRYYRKPASCDEAKGGTWSVDCANDYIRARARFSELYDSGKL